MGRQHPGLKQAVLDLAQMAITRFPPPPQQLISTTSILENMSASQRAQIREHPKVLRGALSLRSAPESALEGALLVVHHREALKSTVGSSEALLGVSLIWAFWLAL